MPDQNPVNDGCFVLMAHGSKNPNWLVPFQQLAKNLKRELGEGRVHLCFMELASPTLEEMAQQLHSEGIRRVRLLPLFLASGSHLCKDVPEQLEQLKLQYPELTIDQLPPIGESAGFAELMGAAVKQYILANPIILE